MVEEEKKAIYNVKDKEKDNKEPKKTWIEKERESCSSNDYVNCRITNNNVMIPLYPCNKTYVRRKPNIPFGKKKTHTYLTYYMTLKNYQKTVKRWCSMLMNMHYPLSYNHNNFVYYHITLTYKHQNDDFIAIQNDIRTFIKALTRKYGKVEYLKVIQFHCNGGLHIHFIICFSDLDFPNFGKLYFGDNYKYDINIKPIRKLWTHGIVNIEKINSMDNIYGLLEYLTLPKREAIQLQCRTHFDKSGYQERYVNSHYSKYPKSVKFISRTYGFGVKSESLYVQIPKSKALDIIEKQKQFYKLEKRRVISNGGNFIREEGHYYLNHERDSFEYCMDKVYLRPTKEFIEENFNIKIKSQ